MDGMILVHKPEGLTSHDIVKEIRKALSIKKVGHFGTLDPMATGLLLTATGKSTRLFPYFSKLDKTYTGKIRLGFATNTYDATGEPTGTEVTQMPDEKQVLETIKHFCGKILQAPPPYSAKKFKGKPLYVLARNQQEIALPPVEVHIYDFSLIKYHPPVLEFKVHCSSGTYIRSLAHDLGFAWGCGAHLAGLERLAIGKYHLKDSFSLEQIRDSVESGHFTDFLIPIEQLLPEFPKIILSKNGAFLAQNGNTIFPEEISQPDISKDSISSISADEDVVHRLFDQEGRLIAFARKSADGRGLHPFLVFDKQDIFP